MSSLDISTSTGQPYYSGSWEAISQCLKVLKVGDARFDTLKREEVNDFQERADREIDGLLEDLYKTPFLAKKKMMPNGTFVSSFPGDLRQAAIYYTASLLLSSEFQGLGSNQNEQTTSMSEKAQKMIYDLRRNTL
jgi:hypothetical protein